MKTKLVNTTVRTSKKGTFKSYFGKGTGSQIAEFATFEEAQKFDSEYYNLKYSRITQISTGKHGGAYFYKGTENMFWTSHPFFNDFKIDY